MTSFKTPNNILQTLAKSLGSQSVTHFPLVLLNCVIIGSDNGLLPVLHQTITQTNADFCQLNPRDKLQGN